MKKFIKQSKNGIIQRIFKIKKLIKDLNFKGLFLFKKGNLKC